MDKLWYYTQGAAQEKKGPVPEDEIRLLIASGQIRATDLLWSDGMANWSALSALPQLQSPSSAIAATAAASPLAAASGQAEIPQGLTAWMTFVAVMTIISGAFYCLGCIWVIIGIPTIIAGTALLGAKNAIANMTTVDSSLAVFFAKMKSFFKLTGIVYIIGFIAGIVFFILYFGVIAAAIAGKAGVQP
jgi:hypothetical protein